MSDKRKCFVVCPIGAAGSETRLHADWLFDEVIQRVFETRNGESFDIIRSDKIDTPGMIDSQIINLLLDADLVIADMSELNPNAFYELGIRHMAQKPIVHMYKGGTPIPFDVKPHRAIEFDYKHPSDLSAARTALTRAVDEALADAHVVDNPVTRAKGHMKIELQALPEMQLLQTQIEELQSAVWKLRLDRKNSAQNAPGLGHLFELGGSLSRNISSSITLDFDGTMSANDRARARKYIMDVVRDFPGEARFKRDENHLEVQLSGNPGDIARLESTLTSIDGLGSWAVG